MPNFLYRFRSTEALLSKYHELENQSIYFASTHQLNDPLEAFKDIFWSGDEIVWKNLLKHYLRCLHPILIQSRLIQDPVAIQLTESSINVFNFHEHDQYKKVEGFAFNTFFKNPDITNFCRELSLRSEPVRRGELLFFLKIIHSYALSSLCMTFQNYDLDPYNPKIATLHEENSKKLSERLKEIGVLTRLHNSPIDLDLIHKNMFYQMDMLSKYANDTDDQNKLFILYDFPNSYINQIENLIHPTYYTASFFEENTIPNPSMWGYYADSHKGICLKFKTNNSCMKLTGLTGFQSNGEVIKPSHGNISLDFYKVNYSERHPEIDFFRSLGQLSKAQLSQWYQDEDGNISPCYHDVFENENIWQTQYHEILLKNSTIKLQGWAHENEYRLILKDTINMYGDEEGNGIEHRTFKYNFSDLDSIIFGIKTPESDKQEIIKIIQRKCQETGRSDFTFYQADFSSASSKIVLIPQSLAVKDLASFS